jgi:hypothetical protein
MEWHELKLNSCPLSLTIFGAEINTKFNQNNSVVLDMKCGRTERPSHLLWI